jgi:hypothetical protein
MIPKIFTELLSKKVQANAIHRSPSGSLVKALLAKLYLLLNFIVSIPEARRCRKYLFGIINERMKNTRTSALVLGNGPSAKKVEWSTVSRRRQSGDLHVFTMNYFLLNKGISPLDIDYVVMSDPGCLPSSQDERTKNLWEIIENNAGTIKVITPTGWHKVLCSDSKLTDTCLHFDDRSLETFSRNISPLQPRGYISMTALKALAVANFIGYKNISFIGIDNDWFRGLRVDGDNRLIQESVHVTSDYHKPIDLTEEYQLGVGDYFYDLAENFLSFRRCFSNLKLINLDKDSLIDFFEKDPNSDLVKLRLDK